LRLALEELRRGHDLGSKDPRWPFPSAQWVRECERLVELDGRLPAVLGGQEHLTNTAERVAFAQLCQTPCKKLFAAATRFYGDAFAGDPKLAEDLSAHHRYHAACTAALAGSGQGNGAKTLNDKDRARLRQQALTWLRDDFKAWRNLLEQRPDKTRQIVAGQMQHWLTDPDFAGVRGEQALARLPRDEQQAWISLWADVEQLRIKVLGKTGAKVKSAKKP
jgi:hypothetical protein